MVVNLLFSLTKIKQNNNFILFLLISDILWLYMNAHSNQLEVSVSKISAENTLEIDCDVNIHVLFQRVK